MDRVVNAPSLARRRATGARVFFIVMAMVPACGLPPPAHALDLSELLRGGTGAQAAREAQRAMQQPRANDATARQGNDAEICAPVKTWVSSVPAVDAQRGGNVLALLDDARFSKAFGRPYDQLTIADFRQLQQVQSACQRAGTLTPLEQQTVQQVLNPSMQPQYARQVATARAQGADRQALLAEFDTLPAGLPGLEKGVAAFTAYTSKHRATMTATDLASLRDELVARRTPAVTAAAPELSAEVQRAKSEAEINALLARYLIDVERQQAARSVTQAAAERVATLRQATEAARVAAAQTERAALPPDRIATPTERDTAPSDRVASSKNAPPASAKPSTSTGGTVLTDPNELRKYEAGHIVRAVYHADMAGLKENALFTRKYLIAQAGHLGGNCDTFKATEVRAYETALQREVASSVQRNTGELLRQSLNMYVQAQRDMTTLVDASAAQQRIEDAPEFAVSDIERLAKTYGGCDSQVIVRYTRNLRAVLDKSR